MQTFRLLLRRMANFMHAHPKRVVFYVIPSFLVPLTLLAIIFPAINKSFDERSQAQEPQSDCFQNYKTTPLPTLTYNSQGRPFATRQQFDQFSRQLAQAAMPELSTFTLPPPTKFEADRIRQLREKDAYWPTVCGNKKSVAVEFVLSESVVNTVNSNPAFGGTIEEYLQAHIALMNRMILEADEPEIKYWWVLKRVVVVSDAVVSGPQPVGCNGDMSQGWQVCSKKDFSWWANDYLNGVQGDIPYDIDSRWVLNDYWVDSVLNWTVRKNDELDRSAPNYYSFTDWQASVVESEAQSYRSPDMVVFPDNRIRHTELSDDGTHLWYRYATWNGTGYDNWTEWSDQNGDLTTLIPGEGSNQAFRSFDMVKLPDNRLRQTMLSKDGTKLWYRYATWDGAAYSSWTQWTNQYGDLTQLVSGQGDSQSFKAFDMVVLPDNKLRQTMLSEDGTKVWYRYGIWDGTAYTRWTDWTDRYGTLSEGTSTRPAGLTFRSFDMVVFPDNRIRNTLVTADGTQSWSSYADWNGQSYSGWSDWTDQNGNLSEYRQTQASRSLVEFTADDASVRQYLLSSEGTELWQRMCQWSTDQRVVENCGQWQISLSLSSVIPQNGINQSYRSFSMVKLADGRIKQSLLSGSGQTVWSRYGKWEGTDYGSWTEWSNQYGDLSTIIPSLGPPQEYVSFSENVTPFNTAQQILVASDKTTIYKREGAWNGTTYAQWSDWFPAGVLISNEENDPLPLLSMSQAVMPDGTLEQMALSDDGKTHYVRQSQVSPRTFPMDLPLVHELFHHLCIGDLYWGNPFAFRVQQADGRWLQFNNSSMNENDNFWSPAYDHLSALSTSAHNYCKTANPALKRGWADGLGFLMSSEGFMTPSSYVEPYKAAPQSLTMTVDFSNTFSESSYQITGCSIGHPADTFEETGNHGIKKVVPSERFKTTLQGNTCTAIFAQPNYINSLELVFYVLLDVSNGSQQLTVPFVIQRVAVNSTKWAGQDEQGTLTLKLTPQFQPFVESLFNYYTSRPDAVVAIGHNRAEDLYRVWTAEDITPEKIANEQIFAIMSLPGTNSQYAWAFKFGSHNSGAAENMEALMGNLQLFPSHSTVESTTIAPQEISTPAPTSAPAPAQAPRAEPVSSPRLQPTPPSLLFSTKPRSQPAQLSPDVQTTE